jgi:hypothetical protein
MCADEVIGSRRVDWDGPEEPDSAGYEIVTLDPCDAEPEGSVEGVGVDWCRLPAGHTVDHRW